MGPSRRNSHDVCLGFGKLMFQDPICRTELSKAKTQGPAAQNLGLRVQGPENLNPYRRVVSSSLSTIPIDPFSTPLYNSSFHFICH